MYINGAPLSTWSLTLVDDLSGWSDGPVVSRDTAQLPNILGVVPASFATAAARQISCTMWLKCSSLADRETKLSAVQDAFFGLMDLTFDDRRSKVTRVILGSMTALPIAEHTHFWQYDLKLRCTFVAMDPISYDIEPRVVSFGSTATPISVGTLPSPGVIYITGSLSSSVARTITYRSFNGIAFGSLTLTPPGSESLGANDYLEISLLRKTIYKVTSTNVRSSVYHWKSDGKWFSPQAADCDRSRSAYPTLEVNSGNGVYVYRQAWAV